MIYSNFKFFKVRNLNMIQILTNFGLNLVRIIAGSSSDTYFNYVMF